jgi:hypothetical protein
MFRKEHLWSFITHEMSQYGYHGNLVYSMCTVCGHLFLECPIKSRLLDCIHEIILHTSMILLRLSRLMQL